MSTKKSKPVYVVKTMLNAQFQIEQADDQIVITAYTLTNGDLKQLNRFTFNNDQSVIMRDALNDLLRDKTSMTLTRGVEK